MSERELIAVEAKINLPNKLRAGDVVLVDPENEYVLACLSVGYMVPLVDEPDDEHS